MRLKSIAFAILIHVLASATVAYASSDTVTSVRAWPASFECNHCQVVQFGILEMRWDTSKVGKILVLSSDSGSLNIYPEGGNAKDSIVLMSVPYERLIGAYIRAGFLAPSPVLSNQDFFDRLGDPAEAASPFSRLRQLEGVRDSGSYLKFSRGKLHAYAIRSVSSHMDAVHFVIDGESTVYTLRGRISNELFHTILSNMQIVAVP